MFRFAQRSRTVAQIARRSLQLHATRLPAQLCIYVVQPNVSSRFYSTVETPGRTQPPKPLTKKSVEERVIKAIKAWDRFPQDRADKLTLDARFVEDLGLDSLDLVEISMSLEDEFGFEIPETDVDKLKTPRDIHKYVCEHEDVFE